MKLIQSLEGAFKEEGKIALTIGTFDGVHKGHQQILSALKKRGIPYVLTFAAHPLKVLRQKAPLAITTTQHKLSLLEKEGVSRCYLLNFTEAFAKQSAEEFLTLLKERLHFSSLILGHDAKIGYGREGDLSCLMKLSEKLDFELEYIPPYSINDIPISSSLIRTKIENNQLEEAALLLGREYSIFAPIIEGAKRGRVIGYPTANINVEGIVLPHLGVWVCYLIHEGKSYPAVGNLGRAPTFYSDRPCLLEVHLLDNPLPPLYGELVEIVFKKHLRAEKHFSTLEALKEQISIDILAARNIAY